jgi:hypothetical protein
MNRRAAPAIREDFRRFSPDPQADTALGRARLSRVEPSFCLGAAGLLFSHAIQ